MTNPIQAIDTTELDTVSGGFCGTPWARHQMYQARDMARMQAAWSRRFDAYRAGYYPGMRAAFRRGWF